MAVLRPEMLRVVSAPQQTVSEQRMLFGRVIATRFIGSSFLHEVALDDGVVATVDVASTMQRVALNLPVGLAIKNEYLASEPLDAEVTQYAQSPGLHGSGGNVS